MKIFLIILMHPLTNDTTKTIGVDKEGFKKEKIFFFPPFSTVLKKDCVEYYA